MMRNATLWRGPRNVKKITKVLTSATPSTVRSYLTASPTQAPAANSAMAESKPIATHR